MVSSCPSFQNSISPQPGLVLNRIFSIWGKQERNGAPEDSSMFPNARQVAGALRCSWAAIALIFAAAAVFSALCRRILAGSCVSIWQVLSFVSS